jgi:hypothetical protein
MKIIVIFAALVLAASAQCVARFSATGPTPPYDPNDLCTKLNSEYYTDVLPACSPCPECVCATRCDVDTYDYMIVFPGMSMFPPEITSSTKMTEAIFTNSLLNAEWISENTAAVAEFPRPTRVPNGVNVPPNFILFKFTKDIKNFRDFVVASLCDYRRQHEMTDTTFAIADMQTLSLLTGC